MEKYSCFQQQSSQFQLEKVNTSEMTILYLKQAYLSYKDKIKIYYCNFLIIAQVVPALHSPESLTDLNETRPK